MLQPIYVLKKQALQEEGWWTTNKEYTKIVGGIGSTHPGQNSETTDA